MWKDWLKFLFLKVFIVFLELYVELFFILVVGEIEICRWMKGDCFVWWSIGWDGWWDLV